MCIRTFFAVGLYSPVCFALQSPIVITYNKLQLPKEKHFDIGELCFSSRIKYITDCFVLFLGRLLALPFEVLLESSNGYISLSLRIVFSRSVMPCM